jgi:hypothetical protein
MGLIKHGISEIGENTSKKGGILDRTKNPTISFKHKNSFSFKQPIRRM